jgi:hypothetical protein
VNAIEDVIGRDANQAGEDNRNVARMAALLAGLPVSVCGQHGKSFMCFWITGHHGCKRQVMCGERINNCGRCGKHDKSSVCAVKSDVSFSKTNREFLILPWVEI